MTSTNWTTATTTTSAPTASCTWLGHCLGDPCRNYNDCDNDWICSNSVCVLYSSVPPPPTSTAPAQHGLATPTAVGIGIAVPCCIAVIAGVAYLIWRARRKKRRQKEADEKAVRRGFGKAELGTEGKEKQDDGKFEPLPAVNAEPVELPDFTAAGAAELGVKEPVELDAEAKDNPPAPHDPDPPPPLPPKSELRMDERRMRLRPDQLQRSASDEPGLKRRPRISPLNIPSSRTSPASLATREALNRLSEEELGTGERHTDSSYTLFSWPNVNNRPLRPG